MRGSRKFRQGGPGPEVIKCFMINPSEHEISTAQTKITTNKDSEASCFKSL